MKQRHIFLLIFIFALCQARPTTNFNDETEKIRDEIFEEDFIQVSSLNADLQPNNPRQLTKRADNEKPAQIYVEPPPPQVNEELGSGNAPILMIDPTEPQTTPSPKLLGPEDNTETTTEQAVHTLILSDAVNNATVNGNETVTEAIHTGDSINATADEAKAGRDQVSESLAFYLGISAAALIGAWLVLGPLICCILHYRRRWRERQYGGVPPPPRTSGNAGGSWFSRWGRGGQSQRPLVAANRAPTPPRLGDPAAIPLREAAELQNPPTITISEPYTSQAMTTFAVPSSPPQSQEQHARSTMRTDI